MAAPPTTPRLRLLLPPTTSSRLRLLPLPLSSPSPLLTSDPPSTTHTPQTALTVHSNRQTSHYSTSGGQPHTRFISPRDDSQASLPRRAPASHSTVDRGSISTHSQPAASVTRAPLTAPPLPTETPSPLTTGSGTHTSSGLPSTEGALTVTRTPAVVSIPPADPPTVTRTPIPRSPSHPQ